MPLTFRVTAGRIIKVLPAVAMTLVAIAVTIRAATEIIDAGGVRNAATKLRTKWAELRASVRSTKTITEDPVILSSHGNLVDEKEMERVRAMGVSEPSPRGAHLRAVPPMQHSGHLPAGHPLSGLEEHLRQPGMPGARGGV